MTKPEEPELAPCPWCGEDAIIDKGQEVYRIVCGYLLCDIHPSTRWYVDIFLAFAAWNTRKGKV